MAKKSIKRLEILSKWSNSEEERKGRRGESGKAGLPSDLGGGLHTGANRLRRGWVKWCLGGRTDRAQGGGSRQPGKGVYQGWLSDFWLEKLGWGVSFIKMANMGRTALGKWTRVQFWTRLVFWFAGMICFSTCMEEETLKLGPRVYVDIYLVERSSLSTSFWGKGSPFSQVIKVAFGTFSQKKLLEKRHPQDHPQERILGISYFNFLDFFLIFWMEKLRPRKAKDLFS